MPVIVDEVVISVEVTNQASKASTAPQSSTDERQEIVNECVERVLDILRQRGER